MSMFKRLKRRLWGKEEPSHGYCCPVCNAPSGDLYVRWSAAGKHNRTVQAMMEVECMHCGRTHVYLGRGREALRTWAELHGMKVEASLSGGTAKC